MTTQIQKGMVRPDAHTVPARRSIAKADAGGPIGVGIRLRAASLELDGRRVLRGLNVELAAGSNTLVVGANGAGKSEFLKLLAAHRWPQPTSRARRAYVDSVGNALELSDILPRLQLVSADQQERYERQGWNFTVASLVGTGCRGLIAPLGPLTASERRIVADSLAICGVGKLRRRRFLTLSYGQRRLVLIARALAARPWLLLLDEAYNGLDLQNRVRLDRLLTVLAESPITLVMSAHHAEDGRPEFNDVIAIEKGQIRYAGSRRSLPRPWRALVAPAAKPRPRRLVARKPGSDVPLAVLSGLAVYREGRRVFHRLSWTIDAKYHWAVVGPNGSGKSTLLGLIYGAVVAADVGQLVRRGHSRRDALESWQRRVRLVTPEQHQLATDYPTITRIVLSGLPEMRRLRAKPNSSLNEAALNALRVAGIRHLAERSPRAVSYGELRLALLARSLIGDPEALLLDEPFAGLDAHMRLRLMRVIEAVAASGTQLVFALHEPGDFVPCIGAVLILPSAQTLPRTDYLR